MGKFVTILGKFNLIKRLKLTQLQTVDNELDEKFLTFLNGI